MATTKSTETHKVTEPIKETEPVKETVFIPKVPGEDASVFVGINGKSWQIPRGKSVEVPVYVAELLRDRQRKAEAADEFAAIEQAKIDAAKRMYGI